MTDYEVIESFDNSWRAMCSLYRDKPTQELQTALNMVGRIIDKVRKEVDEAHAERQITIDEWMEWLELNRGNNDK